MTGMIIDLAGRVPTHRGHTAGGVTTEEPLRAALDVARDAYVETDCAGVVTQWNRRAELQFGWPRDRVEGRAVWDFLVPNRSVAHLDRLLEGVRSGRLGADRFELSSFDVRHADGSVVPVSATACVTGTGDHLRIGAFLHADEDEATRAAVAHAHLHDSLTGLPNRTLFNYRLTYALAKHRRHSGAVAVAILDVDRFRAINDGLSHEVGDLVLQVIAERLKAADVAAATIARLGGDEFLVLFDGPGAEHEALAFADRSLRLLAEPIPVADREIFLTASVGIAATSPTVDEAGSLLSNADAAMYQAKARGGGGIEVSGEMLRARLFDRVNLEHALHRAIERRELRLFYQPVVRLDSSAPVGVEALLRWDHPSMGMVPPDGFIATAEESGLIVPIGRWVLDRACQQMSLWQRHEGRGLFRSLAVNLSARQLTSPDLLHTVETALDASGLAAGSLTLEITETALMADLTTALGTLRALRGIGVRIAMDDFGTGYSSLSQLHQMPLDILKIDRSFVRRLEIDREGTEILSAIIRLGHAMRLQVVAEGVESAAQAELLRSMGCDLAQGYLYGRPAPAPDLYHAVVSETA